MGEYRAWKKTRRKRLLRLAAAVLSFCLLFTTYPDILETLSVFAAGTQGGDSTVYVTGFAGLPEEVREQTVPVGTGAEELMLPDTLEAVAAITEGEALPEDAQEETEAPPESAEEETEAPPESAEEGMEAPPEGTGEETEFPETEGTEPEESADNTQSGEETDGEDAASDNESGQTEESQGTEPEASEEAGDTESEEGKDTEPEGTAAGTAVTEEADIPENSDNAGDSGESEPSVQTEDAELTQESHTVAMPEYQAENVVTVGTLENTWETGTKEETIIIQGVTWQPETAYDGNTEGIYIFIAILPEGYALMEGASLPQITVTVQADSADSMIQALLDRIAALPDSEEYLAKEPDIEAEEAYAEWMEGLYQYAGEALDIQEAYEALTEKQQAQISEEALTKLAAWAKITEQVAGNSMVMTAESGDLGDGLHWEYNSGTLTISKTGSGEGKMPDYRYASTRPWHGYKDNITSIKIQQGVTHIGNNAFYGLGSPTNGISSVEISDSVASIGGCAFKDSAITQVTIPDKVTIIEYGAFENTQLTSVTIPGKVTTICMDTFRDCESLNSVSIPNSVEKIDSFAFLGCKSLARVDIPSSVTEMRQSVFKDCLNLATVNFTRSTPPTLLWDFFTNSACLKNKGIMIPCSWKDSDLTKDNGWDTYKTNVTRVHSNLTPIAGSSATCTATGTKKHWKCSCGALLIENEEGKKIETTEADLTIEKSSHSYAYTASGQVIIETCQTCSTHTATATLSVSETSHIYTGSAITPAAVTYSDDWAGAKPTVGYSDNINKGTVTASITVNGVEASAAFTIEPKPLTDDMITFDSGPHSYTGSEIKPAVTVKDGRKTLVTGTDYTVSYENNVNPGTATVKITGTNNYTGTFSKNFTIEYSLLPSGKSLMDYVAISPSPTDDWYGFDIILTPQGNCGVGETSTDIGSGVTISDETGTGGSTKVIFIKDENGNIYQAEFSYKLDKTPPAVDLAGMSVENGKKTLWNWITGNTKMIIKIPDSCMTETLSGIAEVSYTATPGSGGAGKGGTIPEKDSTYEIALDEEFTGTIQLMVKDKAGHTTQVTLPAENGKIIAEDYAPVVKITPPVTPAPNKNGWYNTPITLTVTVTDDKDSGSAEILSGGIAEIKWKDEESGFPWKYYRCEPDKGRRGYHLHSARERKGFRCACSYTNAGNAFSGCNAAYTRNRYKSRQKQWYTADTGKGKRGCRDGGHRQHEK